MKATSRAPRIIRRVLKILASLLIIAVNTVLIWRIFFSASIPAQIKTLTPTDGLRAAYAQSGDALTLRYQEQATVTQSARSYGYFGVPQVVFIPEIQQVQLVFRYNDSTLKHLAKDYGLEATPDKALTHFDVTLLKTTDLTPDNKEDNIVPETLSSERFFPTTAYTERDTTSLYTYYRYVFDGVTIEDVTAGIFVDVYYVGDVNYEKLPYGTLCLYDAPMPWISYKLTSADKKELAIN